MKFYCSFSHSSGKCPCWSNPFYSSLNFPWFLLSQQTPLMVIDWLVSFTTFSQVPNVKQGQSKEPSTDVSPEKIFVSTWSCLEWRRGEGETRYTSNFIHKSEGILQLHLRISQEFYSSSHPLLLVTIKSILFQPPSLPLSSQQP